jgi:condensin complex subunit 3
MVPAEEEKKVVALLLGKLHVSPASSEDKIRALYEDVSLAVEDNILSDATSRNALYKIHVSLGKIVNQLDARTGAADAVNRRSVSVSRSVGTSASTRQSVAGSVAGDEEGEDPTILAPETVKEEDEQRIDAEDDVDDDGDTAVERTAVDSASEDALSD